MNSVNDRFRAHLGVDKWHALGYTGKRCLVGYGEDFENTDDYASHARNAVTVFHEIAPDAEVVYLPENGASDSSYMSEQMQTIVDKNICCWGTSRITATSGKDVDRAFEKVSDFCSFFCSIGNWNSERYARLSESNYVFGVGAYHLNEDGTFYPEPYSSEAECVDFAAPTDLFAIDHAFDGTSCAQPVMLGMATLVNDFFIDKTGKPLSSKMMYQFLKDNSHDLYTLGKDTKTGWGYVTLPDPNTIDIAKYQPTYQKEDESLSIIEKTYNWAYALTPRTQTTKLILHHSATTTATPEQIHVSHLANGWAGIAYHIFIRKDGSKYRGRPLNMMGGHTKDYNHCSIGICFEGNFETEYMTDAQLEAGQEVIAEIKRLYPNIEIGKHKDYNPTACPGKNFPFTYIVNPVNGTPEDEVSDTDNIPSDWAKDAWKWGIDNGITDGTRPHDNITREQVVTMLWRANK